MSAQPYKNRYEKAGRPPGDRTGHGQNANYYESGYDSRGRVRGRGRPAANWRNGDYHDNRRERKNTPSPRDRGRGAKYINERTRDGRVKKPGTFKKPPSERLAETLGKFADGGNAPIFFNSPADPHTGFLHLEFKSTFEDDDGWRYDSVEMYVLVHEAKYCSEDPKLWKRVLQASKAEDRRNLIEAADFRRLFKPKEGYKTWEDERASLLHRATYRRFAASQKWKELLLATGDRELVFAHPNSANDGIGFSAGDAEANRGKWGQNLMGNANMKVRKQLRDEEAKQSKPKAIATIDSKAEDDKEQDYESEFDLDVAECNEYSEQSDQAPVREAVKVAAEEEDADPVPSIEVDEDGKQVALAGIPQTGTGSEDEDDFNIDFD